MQGYQQGQGQWPGGYDKGVSMIKQSGRASENTPERYREKETDSPKMSMVTHALESLRDMRGGESRKRPARDILGDSRAKDAKWSRFDSGGPPDSMGQSQDDSWRCTKCNSKNIEGRNYCILCYSSRDVGDLSSEGHRLPSKGHHLPSEGHRLPPQGHRLPSKGHDLPSKGRGKVREDKASTLYVFDLLLTTTTPDLFKYFSQWGGMIDVYVKIRDDGISSGKGLVQYMRREDAQAALAACPHFIQKKQIIVTDKKKADPRKSLTNMVALQKYKLYVTNIPADVTQDELFKYFSQWGNMFSCELAGKLGRGNKFGFVSFTNEEDALKCLKFPSHSIQDRILYIHVSDKSKSMLKTENTNPLVGRAHVYPQEIPSASASLEPSQKISLFVSNIPTGMTSDELLEHFSKWGKVDSCTISYRSKNNGFVSFIKDEDALKCLDAPHVLQDRRLFVRLLDTSKQSSQKIKLFVSNIPTGATSSELTEHFSKWGKIHSCTISRQNKNNGYVSFDKDADGLKCLDVPHILKTQKLFVCLLDKNTPLEEAAKDTTNISAVQEKNKKHRLFVTNVPVGTNLGEVYNYFVKWGDLDYYVLKPTGANKLMAVLTYVNEEDALRCLDAVHTLNGSQLSVRCSVSKGVQKPLRASDAHKSDVTRDAPARPARSAQNAPARPARSPQNAPARPARSPQDALVRPARSPQDAFVRPARSPQDALVRPARSPQDALARPARSAQDAPARPARSARPASPRQSTEAFQSWRKQRYHETVQTRILPETVKSQRLVSHPQDAMEPQRLPEDAESRRMSEDFLSRGMPEGVQPQRLPEDAKSRRMPENVQSRRIPEDIHPQKLPEVYQPRLLPEDVQPRRQSSPEHFVPGLTPADSVSGTPPNIPLGTEYDCNVSGCFYKGTSLQFERHWTERHEAKVVDLICPFCSMGCVDADDFCEHLDFFHGVEDKIEKSKFLQKAKQEERDNIHYVMPGSVTKESCMRVAEPVQHEPTRLKAPPPLKEDARDAHKFTECTFTGTMDASLNLQNKNHVSELTHLRCPICPKTFKKKAALQFHMKHVHPNIEMYTEKEPEDLEANFEESQNCSLESSQHETEEEVTRSQTHIQTISGMGSRSIHDGNRSTKEKRTSSPPLQSFQNVSRPNLVPSLPTQQPVPRLDPPPLATHVPLPPLQLIQSQQTIVSAPPLMDRHPVPPPTDIPTQQAVPLLGVVTPFYPSTASVPNPVPPPPRPSVSTPQLAVASPLHLLAYPQPSDTGIANTFTQKTVAAASRPVVGTQSHIVPPISFSQAPFQPEVSAQSQQAPIMAPQQSQVGDTVTPSVVPQTYPQAVTPPQLPLTGQVISQSLQHGSAPQPVQPQMSQPEVLMKQPPVDSQSVTMPSADPCSTPPLNPLDLINVYKGSKETQKRSTKDVQKRLSKQEKTSNEPQNGFHMMERLEDANIKLRRRLKADVGEEEEDDKEHEGPKETLEEFSDNSGQSRKDLQQRTDPHGQTSDDIQQRTDKDSRARDKFQRRTDYGVDTDPKEMLKESSDEESNVNLEVKGTLSQAHGDMRARARTIAKKVVGDYRNEQVAGKTTNIHTKAATVSPARNQGHSKEGKIKPGLVDNKVLGQLLMKSIGMVKYQSKRANVDADLIRKGISWAKNEIIDMLKQDEKMTLTETDEGSREAGFQQRTDNREWSRKEFQQRTDNCPRSRNKFQQRTDNSGQAGEDLQQRADNHSHEGEDLQQRADNHPCLRNRFQLRTDNRGCSSKDLQQRTDYRSHTGEDLQQRADYRSRTGEDLQQRADNHGQAGEDLQQWADHRGRTREDDQRRTDKQARSSNKFYQRTDNPGWSRKEFQNRRDWNVEKEEHVEVYVDEYGNEDEEYVLAYVDEDGVHVMDDGFVMGEGGPVKKGEQMGEETDDMYYGIDQGSRSNRIREESRSHGQRGYGGGETTSGHRILDERDMQIYERCQEEYIEDDRFSEEEYLEYRDDDRISSSSSSHSMRRNEDRRSQRFEEQMPRESVLDERRHFSPPLSRYSERQEDEYEVFEEVDSYQVSNEHFNEGHGPSIEDKHYIEEDEGYVHNERVNYGMYNEYKEDFDRVRTRSAQQDSTWRGGGLDRDRRYSKRK
ncbi:uncharacterized protein LOC124121362 isoform X2 [Haliotis rufescens]|uniref:uncharacterized protein LOC124121362 isoform X2 n=1 Tax=Haliotis rufescens TaxID=6454 RepID=UPI00201F353E|nr:uncharacterized protein LOC124121362 isoform X2 [Haliotis rufescens]